MQGGQLARQGLRELVLHDEWPLRPGRAFPDGAPHQVVGVILAPWVGHLVDHRPLGFEEEASHSAGEVRRRHWVPVGEEVRAQGRHELSSVPLAYHCIEKRGLVDAYVLRGARPDALDDLDVDAKVARLRDHLQGDVVEPFDFGVVGARPIGVAFEPVEAGVVDLHCRVVNQLQHQLVGVVHQLVDVVVDLGGLVAVFVFLFEEALRDEEIDGVGQEGDVEASGHDAHG